MDPFTNILFTNEAEWNDWLNAVEEDDEDQDGEEAQLPWPAAFPALLIRVDIGSLDHHLYTWVTLHDFIESN